MANAAVLVPSASNGLAVATMVLGIIGLLLAWIPHRWGDWAVAWEPRSHRSDRPLKRPTRCHQPFRSLAGSATGQHPPAWGRVPRQIDVEGERLLHSPHDMPGFARAVSVSDADAAPGSDDHILASADAGADPSWANGHTDTAWWKFLDGTA